MHSSEKMKPNLPLVSVPVITYNSSKTVIATLDSIYNQTYPKVELIVSDDCSSDDTLKLVRTWLKTHQDRFVRVVILAENKNTGTCCNCNRAEDACEGDWIKLIAGDDLLRETCIDDFVSYVEQHPSSICVFGKIHAFGGTKEHCLLSESAFDYSFFDKSVTDQLHYLIYERNCIPAAAAFYHRETIRELNVRFDERLFIIEDYPRWINLLKKGVRFDFIDKEVVDYRVNTGVSNGILSPLFYCSMRKFTMLYLLPEWLKSNPEDAYRRLVEHESKVYELYYRKEEEIEKLVNSKAYRLGKAMLRPFKKSKVR